MCSLNITIIEHIKKDCTEWGLSFGGSNPIDEDYFIMTDKETAFRLKGRLTISSPITDNPPASRHKMKKIWFFIYLDCLIHPIRPTGLINIYNQKKYDALIKRHYKFMGSRFVGSLPRPIYRIFINRIYGTYLISRLEMLYDLIHPSNK